jgi:apolipoprotein N-acyltransferase
MQRFTITNLILLIVGALHSFGFAPSPFTNTHDGTNWPIQTACLAYLIWHCWRLGNGSAASAGRAGLMFGIGWFCAGIYWIFISMHVYGHLPIWLSAIATLALAMLLASFYGFACFVTQWLWRRINISPRWLGSYLVLFAANFALAELARGFVMTGFPWLSIGYAHTDSPLAALAPVIGVYGISFAACLVAGAFALMVSTHADTRTRFALPIIILASAWALPQAIVNDWTKPTQTISVSLLQGNVEQSMKFRPDQLESTLQNYAAQIQASKADLIVLPETAWPTTLDRTPTFIAQKIEATLASGKTKVAVGLPWIQTGLDPLKMATFDGRLPISNSVAVLSQPSVSLAAVSYRYDKQHLVPFGEVIPFGFKWFVSLMQIPLGEFYRGAPVQAPMLLGTEKISFNVCYEDLFPQEIAATVSQNQSPTILINVSNLGWFGLTRALDQHLQISRMRALENGRPMLRATNTGATSHIDDKGKVVSILPYGQSGVLHVNVTGASGITPYSRLQNTPILVFSLGILAIAAWVTSVGQTGFLRGRGNSVTKSGS